MAVKKTAKKTAKRKPPNAGKGRKLGSKNVVKKGIRDALEQALACDPDKKTGESGEIVFFKKMKEEQPVAFLNIVAKLLPVQVEADIKGEIDNNVTITFVGSAPSDG